jgi:glycosyltransferase involved in cell wall biosynthesis
MRILIASCVPGRREGGVAGVMQNLGRELERLGHTVEFVYREDLIKKSPRRFDVLYFAVKLAAKILRERGKYSVVNIHAPNGFVYGFLRKVLPQRHCPPYVMTMHGLEERRVHAMGREARKGRAWNFGLKNRLWHRLYHRPLYSFSIRTADCAILLNRETWSYVQIKYDRDSQRVWYVPNGVEERFFLRREYPIREAPRLLYVGTWLDQRGIYYLGEALKIASKKLPEIRLTVAGCLIESRAVKMVFDPALHPQIEVIPFVDAAEMPAVYAEHDIFIFPSLLEGMPLVLLEAMATGMPVITTETCGMTDVVEHDVNGLLVPPADTAALVQAILRLSESAELRRTLGQAAQERMRRYTWDKIARKVEKVFALAMQNQGNKAKRA